MTFIPVYVREKDLPLLQMVAAKLNLDESQAMRSQIGSVCSLDVFSAAPKVAVPQPLRAPDGEPLVPATKRSGHRGPDRDKRKTPSHPKRIEDYIMEFQGDTLTAPALVERVQKLHHVRLKIGSVSSILAQLYHKGKITKYFIPKKGHHVYLIKPKTKPTKK